MELVIVEREFPEPVTFDEVQEAENHNVWCLELHRVQFVRTYFSADRRRMICLYEAPDAESVRLAQEKAGLPFVRIWTTTVHELPEDTGSA